MTTNRYDLIEAGHCFSTVEAASAEAALDTIDPDWVDYGDPDEVTRATRYTEITARNVDDEDDCETRTFRMEPPAPPCADGHAHEWSDDHDLVGGLAENPGVWGHGGGVRIHTACIHCGCGKVVDTWATDPLTGEQGLQALEFHHGQYAEPLAARRATTTDDEE